jgi:hypothetical protein
MEPMRSMARDRDERGDASTRTDGRGGARRKEGGKRGGRKGESEEVQYAVWHMHACAVLTQQSDNTDALRGSDHASICSSHKMKKPSM